MFTDRLRFATPLSSSIYSWECLKKNQADWTEGKKGTQQKPCDGSNKPCLNLYYIGMDLYNICMNSYLFTNIKYSF